MSSRSGVAARSTTSTAASTAVIDEGALPGVDDARARLPHARVGGARGDGDRAPLGGHGDPVVGLGEHGRLARDRVAEDGEPVGGADEEGVEAVEVVEAALERLLERGALAQPPGEVPGGDLGVVLGPELDPLAPQRWRSRLWFESDPLWTRQTSSRWRTGATPPS